MSQREPGAARGSTLSDCDLRAEFDHAVGRKLEEPRRCQRVRCEPGIERDTPVLQARVLARHQGLAADKERGGIDVDDEALLARTLERTRHIGCLEEAIADTHLEEALAELLD